MVCVPVFAHGFGVSAREYEFITGTTARFDFLCVMSLTVQTILVGTVGQVNWKKDKTFN